MPGLPRLQRESTCLCHVCVCSSAEYLQLADQDEAVQILSGDQNVPQLEGHCTPPPLQCGRYHICPLQATTICPCKLQQRRASVDLESVENSPGGR
eukprot:9501822-Pyramimonas_sp.AAC.1